MIRRLLDRIGHHPTPDRPFLWYVGAHTSVYYPCIDPSIRPYVHIGRTKKKPRLFVVKVIVWRTMICWDRHRYEYPTQ